MVKTNKISLFREKFSIKNFVVKIVEILIDYLIILLPFRDLEVAIFVKIRDFE